MGIQQQTVARLVGIELREGFRQRRFKSETVCGEAVRQAAFAQAVSLGYQFGIAADG